MDVREEKQGAEVNTTLSPNQIAYGRSEEITNIVSHLVGTVAAVAASVLMIVKAAITGNPLSVVSISLFSASLIALYLMSTLYHSQPIGKRRRAVFRRFDHCSVALLIAGTYAPYMLIGFAGMGLAMKIWGIVIASVVLLMAVLVVVFNAVNPHKFKVFSMIAYIVMGWACVIRVDALYALGVGAFWFLLGGGFAYSLGIIFYKIKKIPFNHAIWHFFVLIGSVLHFISIYFYIL